VTAGEKKENQKKSFLMRGTVGQNDGREKETGAIL